MMRDRNMVDVLDGTLTEPTRMMALPQVIEACLYTVRDWSLSSEQEARVLAFAAKSEALLRDIQSDAFTPAAVDQDARDQERFDAGYKAGYEAAQREWMKLREGGEDE